MKKNYTSLFSVFFFVVIIACVFYFMMPQNFNNSEKPLSEFSTKRALAKVKAISAKPHFVGTNFHENVAQYLLKNLQKMGLNASFHEGFTMTEKGTLVKSKNILAKIKGTSNGKALLLLSHYDSAPHSFSHGASDDASGVATIFEGVRAFLFNKTKPKNDIIILFTDAEELGLNGAALFVTQHQWAKQIGVVLNFEARGTSGPSYMLMETNNGNSKMVDAFSNANTKFPVSNSLMYSIYKMLPNDTDLTVFREKGNIQGYNFAFIDNHFNYHTEQDNYQNLNKNTLTHQGEYLMPLLNYFANASLEDLNSNNDKVYFNIPFGFINYPFQWIFPMLIGAFVLFLFFTFVGLGKRTLRLDEVIKGFLPFLGSILASGLIGFFGWKLLQNLYPQYNDILQGFTYNGHDYIFGFVALTLGVCFLFYKKSDKNNLEMSQLIFPLIIWFVLNLVISINLKGASFFIIPLIFSVLMLGFHAVTQKSNWLLNCILSIPALVIFIPFIQMFPIGLGLKMLAASCVLTALTFALLLPVFGSFIRKPIWAILCFLISIGFFYKAHSESNYDSNKLKPNSLLYVINADNNTAFWTTYDKNLDSWTKKQFGEKPENASILNLNKFYSKYDSEFTFMKKTAVKNIEKPTIEFLKDSISGVYRNYIVKITPNRKVNRYDLFANEKLNISNFKANGAKAIDLKSNIISKKTNKILSYYIVNNEPLLLEFSIASYEELDLTLIESSFDLLENPLFNVQKRPNNMMPTPFVLNNAVVIKQKLKPSPKPVIAILNPVFTDRKPYVKL